MVYPEVYERFRVREAVSGKSKEASLALCHQLEQENNLNQYGQGLLLKPHI